MSLLDKTWRGLVYLSILLSVACDNSSSVGLELETGDNQTEVLFREFDLPTRTVYIDSLRTDGTSNLIFGHHEDSIFGSVNVKGYTEIQYRNGAIPADTLDLESGIMYLEAGDLLTSNVFVDLNVEVRVLNDEIFNFVVYEADQITNVDNEVVGELSIAAADGLPIVVVDLDEEFTTFLWEHTLNANNIADIDLNVELSVQDENGGIITLDLNQDSTFIQLNSLDSRDTVFNTFFDFENHFHTVERDRSTGIFSSLQESGDLTISGDVAYINALSGLYTSIDLSEFIAFLDENLDVVINNADLEIPVVGLDVNRVAQKNDNLRVFFSNETNQIDGPGALLDFENNGLAIDAEYAEFNLDRGQPTTIRILPLDEEDFNYDDDITLFSQYLIQRRVEDSTFVTTNFILFPTNNFSVEQTGLVAPSVKLKVFYTTLNE